jgi:hypothetical protein
MPTVRTTAVTTPPTTPTTIATQNTIPGAGSADDTAVFPIDASGANAGGYDPAYKTPTTDKFKDPAQPYIYTNKDWQMILSMPNDKFTELQGWLTKIFPGQFKNPNPGNKNDPKTIYYAKEAMGLINTSPEIRGKQLSDALPLLAKTPIITSTGAGKKLPAYSVTNPADLRAVFKKTAQDLLGRTLGDGDLNRMVEAYQQKESTYQKAAYAGGGVNVSQAPNAQTFAQSSLENDFGTEVNTQKLDGIFSSLNDMLMKGK